MCGGGFLFWSDSLISLSPKVAVPLRSNRWDLLYCFLRFSHRLEQALKLPQVCPGARHARLAQKAKSALHVFATFFLD